MGMQWVVAIPVVLAVLALLALFSRKSVRAALTIQATPAEVWSVLSNPASYADWNPVMVSLEGAFEEGATLSVETKNPDGSTSVFAIRVAEVLPNQRLNQVGGVPGLLTFDHTWRLTPVEGGTKVSLREVYRGIGVLFLDAVWVEAAYRRAIIQLRDLVESRGRQQRGIEDWATSGPMGQLGTPVELPSPIEAGCAPPE